MNDTVKLVGLDFGTTTSSAVAATARLCRNSVSGRMDLTDVRESFRSELVLTPMAGDGLDFDALRRLTDDWLRSACRDREELFGGGALLTGLAARRDNAAQVLDMVRERLGDALVASADDPCLESWLAFMGSCAELSRSHPDVPFLNVDIGGGTTNLALGQAGDVKRTGCLFVGARHIEVVAGSYRIVRISPHARQVLDHLGIEKTAGGTLAREEVAQVIDFFLSLLLAAIGRGPPVDNRVAAVLTQVPFARSSEECPVVTFSGGVGELIYRHLKEGTWPSTTQFGDLGIDLAQALVASPAFTEDLQRFQPQSGGRATVYGLLRHSTELSGTTLFLSKTATLPLLNMLILGTIGPRWNEEAALHLLDLVRRAPGGGCLRVLLPSSDGHAARDLGLKLHTLLCKHAFPREKPLVLLLRENLGKLLGNYATGWGALPVQLIVLDEINLRNAQYARIGTPRNQVIPVAFHGLRESREV